MSWLQGYGAQLVRSGFSSGGEPAQGAALFLRSRGH